MDLRRVHSYTLLPNAQKSARDEDSLSAPRPEAPSPHRQHPGPPEETYRRRVHGPLQPIRCVSANIQIFSALGWNAIVHLGY